ncbi:MAG: 5'/3'-nucleotidase SurE [Acidimicrobiia bacterium]|nr:5'/3'-nucleotidase SurE [Acidimicrobiia bacterium]
MRVQITNDDGVEAEGLAHLAAAMVELGHEVIVVAPRWEMSGSGASTGPLHSGTEFEVSQHTIAGLDVAVHAVAGPPALSVMAARLGAFGVVPDVVVSGINPGMNTGRGALHSGTVGAALTAQAFGMSALAVSLDVPTAQPGDRASVGTPGSSAAPGVQPQWATARRVAQIAMDWLAEAPRRTVLNVNVPDRRVGELEGVRWARAAATSGVRASVAPAGPGRLRLELTPSDLVLRADTDTARVQAGYVTVTTLDGITAGAEIPVAEALEAALR